MAKIVKVDSYFEIGKQHQKTGLPCQDYSITEQVNKEFAFAILSDGCSGGKHTDVGARLVTLATKKVLNTCCSNNELDLLKTQIQSGQFIHNINTTLQSFKSELDLTMLDILASLQIIIQIKETILIYTYGDGAVIYGTKNNYTLTHYEFKGNMPLYPAYLNIADLNLLTEYNQYPMLPTTIPDAICCKQVCSNLPEENAVSNKAYFTLNEAKLGFLLELNSNQCDFVCITSDGIQHYEKSINEVIPYLINYKSTEGVFLKRRMNRARELDIGVSNDDMAIATMLFIPEG